MLLTPVLRASHHHVAYLSAYDDQKNRGGINISCFILAFLIAGILLVAPVKDLALPNHEIPNCWSKKKANAWYANQPWPCGFNYIPANASSYTEMWMPYCFDSKKIDKEMALADNVGFNCLRVVLTFVIWKHDPEQCA